MTRPDPERFRAYLEREIAETRHVTEKQREMRRLLEDMVRLQTVHPGSREVEHVTRRNSRRRPPGMAPALVEPPRGPKPLSSGAAAPLEFD